MPEVLLLRHVSKSFAGVRVLDDVSLAVHSGEVVALCGANGAGKSTLIKVVTGYFPTYEGDVAIAGKSVRLRSPAIARASGVDAVYQEVDTCIAPDLTVAENLLLYRLADGRVPYTASHRWMMDQAAQVAQAVDLSVDLAAKACDLTLQQKQLLVIARAIAENAKVLIFDEPTASLSFRETALLFATLRALRKRGLGIVYVSHRLNEVQAISDRVAVLRNGRLVQFFDQAPDASVIGAAMLGAPLEEEFPSPLELENQRVPVFEVRDIWAGRRVRGVSFCVTHREIFGIAGLVGAGKTELLRALFGADPVQVGEIRLAGRLLRIRKPSDAVAQGIYLVPEERRRQGLFLDFPVYQNLTSAFLGQFCHVGMISSRLELKGARRMMADLQIVGELNAPVIRLSGGNQQKVVIGKWLLGEPAVLLLDEATQGVDIGTRRQIYQLARDVSKRAAVVFASSDIDEVLGVCDRFIVMYGGAVVGEFARGEVDRQTAIELASGARKGIKVS